MMDDGASPYLFLDVPLSGPVEELRNALEKKARMHMKLGELEAAERWNRAYEIARAKLEAVLSAPLTGPEACAVSMPEPARTELAPPTAVELAEAPAPESACAPGPEPSSSEPLDGRGEV